MGKVPPVKGYRLTAHARFEMERRGIEEAEVATVLSTPEQAEVVRPGRVVYQSRFERGSLCGCTCCGSLWTLIGSQRKW
ncbi:MULTISPECIES: DUF4258 domain-containing protein [Caldilinea]|uniref:DUF4258 domain-containing protein n=1 Tax=Caldilinea TaxID=233191 RepID=UPI0035B56F05